MKLVRLIVISIVALVLLGEAAVQLSGMVDVPLYMANNKIGYIPVPNQSGAFMHINTWRINEYSMGAGPFKPDPAIFNLLLVGDSIVTGGNPLADPERLGPQLEKQTGWQVWPISAGSWALQNELTYLRQHPDVLNNVDAIVIVSNSGDFDGPSSWASDLNQPLHHPFPGLLYVIRKYLLPRPPLHVMPEMKVQNRDWRVDLHKLSQSFHKPIYIFMYPDVEELHDHVRLEKQLYAKIPLIQAQVDDAVRIFKVADKSKWNDSLYRDAIHPNRNGNAVLASILHKDMCASPIDKLGCKKTKMDEDKSDSN